MSKAKAYRSLAARQADRAKQALEQTRLDIAKLHEVERLRIKVLALREAKGEAGIAPNYDGGGKPVKYSVWKRFVDCLVSGYVPESLGSDSVQVYCIHCGMPTDAVTAKRIAIGVITEYDEVETTVQPIGSSWEWNEEEVTRIRPAIHKGDGCPACDFAYLKAVAQAKRPRVRIRYAVNGERRSLYADNITQGASLLAEQMGRVELIDCKAVPPRSQGFLNVRVRVAEFTPDPKQITRDMERRALALARLEAIQHRSDTIMAKILAENVASKKAGTRRRVKARLRVFAEELPVRNWLRVADRTQELANG